MIKNVVFDLSEVLLPGLIGVEDKLQLRTGKPGNLIAQALGSYPYYQDNNNLDKLLKSEMSYPEYRTAFLLDVGLSESDGSMFDDQCLQMFDQPYWYTNELLRNVAVSCKLYLLSDHCEVWADYIYKRHRFFEHFAGIVWSYELGATKKGLEPFVAIIEKYQLDPANCLFVDDNLNNINNAREVGFQVVHFTGEESVEHVYAAIGKN